MTKRSTERDLALTLLEADSEEEVIETLKAGEYWDDPTNWRLYGDKEGNFAQAGNQQVLPEAALVEKIVNSVDARLMNECLSAGIGPESESAPLNVRDGVAMFFEARRATDNEAGTLINWPKKKRTEESRFITIAATGGKPIRGHKSKKMCLTIVDQGEGQSAQRLPRTILSLNAKNKQRIRFVQGKFNMGGSGVLRFCGENGIQTVISKRNPALVDGDRDSDSTIDRWAVTVVRREAPSNKSGEPLHSEFTYLAPVNAGEHPRKGEILSFDSEKLSLMPVNNKAYSQDIEWGTAIKLYEYETSVGQSHILRKNGLLYALDRLLPEIALPIRLHECRHGFGGAEEKSYSTPLSGLVVRLEDGKGDNLEKDFPISARVRAGGMNMTARIYAFEEARASTYLKDEGVIFIINGQSHGHIPKSIFTRTKAVALPRLKDSLLVLVDCSTLTARQREDLFMSNRDHLTKKPVRYQVEKEIEQLLKNDPTLRDLQQERRRNDVESMLSEERPLEEVLRKVLKSSRTLETLFLRGQRLAKPFAKGGGDAKRGEGGAADEPKPYRGKRHPSYFRFEKVDYGETLRRQCEYGRRVRVTFTTDVENDYFDRATDRGAFEVESLTPDIEAPSSGSILLDCGYGHWSFDLPPGAKVGDTVTLQITVSDSTRIEPFVNIVELTVLPKQQRAKGKPGGRKRKGGGAGDEPGERGIALPDVILVRDGDEHWVRHHFDLHTACHVISDPIEEGGESRTKHVFYINLDNDSLQTEMKYARQDARLLEAKFKYGNVLLGLAMLHENGGQSKDSEDGSDNRDDESEEGDQPTTQERIRAVTSAVAPVLLPMIDGLSGLQESDFNETGAFGDEE